ncbi:MAG: class I SAM-dependent methyltransferase [Defluviitaleaceae bacterium]|nr:class I SAM-dependent methyltransferase [Defluviitaleaceae bacterium]
MFKSELLNKVGEIYAQGGNIIQYVNDFEKNENNSTEAILISYDYQAGVYVYSYKTWPEMYIKYADLLVDEIKPLGGTSILEAGVGEATTFKHVISNLDIPHEKCYGFDISWSRLKVANDFLQEDTPCTPRVFVADLFNIPLCDNSVDIVYTSHSIEPNGGYEKPILQELYRVAKKYLVLFEPDYELAGEEEQKRMEHFGYVKNLAGTAKTLGYNVIKHELLAYSKNALNPTSIIIIKKDEAGGDSDALFQCPVTKTKLIDSGEIFFAPQPRLMYPVIKNIPCLLGQQAILGCRYEE